MPPKMARQTQYKALRRSHEKVEAIPQHRSEAPQRKGASTGSSVQGQRHAWCSGDDRKQSIAQYRGSPALSARPLNRALMIHQINSQYGSFYCFLLHNLQYRVPVVTVLQYPTGRVLSLLCARTVSQGTLVNLLPGTGSDSTAVPYWKGTVCTHRVSQGTLVNLQLI